MTLSLTRGLILVLTLLLATAAGPGRTYALDGDLFLGFDEDAHLLGVDQKDFAGSAIAVGDVSGDGIGDILVGVERSNGFQNQDDTAGEVALVLGGATLTGPIELETAETTFFAATDSANLGTGVGIGDIDGDTIGDVIMGAPKADGRNSFAGGAAYVFYGGTRLPRGDIRLSEQQADVTLFGTQEGRLGVSIAVGNFDGDTFDDFVVSAPREGAQFGRPQAGVLYVFFGGPADVEPVEISITIVTPPRVLRERVTAILGPGPQARAGRGLAAGDVNGDGFDDIIIGSSVDQFRQRAGSGEVYVLFGGTSRLEPRDDAIEVDLADPAQVDLRILGPEPGDSFGLAVGVANIDGDGAGDILIGAPTAEVALPGLLTGRAYAIFGRSFSSGLVKDLAMDPADVTLSGPHDDAELGATVTGGDLDDDGFDEWIIGAPGADVFGQAYRLGGRPQSEWPALGLAANLTQGFARGDRAGAAVATGDVSGDGLPDLVVASPQFNGERFDRRHSGAVWIINGPLVHGPNLPCIDADADGFSEIGRTCGPKDCDDGAPGIGACAPGTCEGQDNDGDGWPGAADSECIITDCDDNRPDIYPGGTETCGDGLDNDCDGKADAEDVECGVPCTGQDADGDGWRSAGPDFCTSPDCNDTDPTIHPGVAEIGALCNDGIDNDCDGRTDVNDRTCQEDGGGGGGVEICSNCVDDDADGLTDLLDRDCDPAPIEVKAAVLRKAKKSPATIKKLLVKSTLPNTVLLDGALEGNQSEPGSEAAASAGRLTVGLSFDSDVQLCVVLDEVTKRRKKNKMLFRASEGQPVGKLRVKVLKKGRLKIKYRQKGGVELSNASPERMTFGIYSPIEPYGGATLLRNKNGRKLVGSPPQ